jgi:outer membrane protein assembly factor BamB
MFSDRSRRDAVFFAVGGAVAVACAGPAAVRRRPEAVQGASDEAVDRRAAHATTPLVTDADRAMGIEWRFDAGGTVPAMPAVGSDGSVYLGTAAGYLVALGATGVVQWSYTVEGAIAWSPVVDATGRIYAATTAQRLCSFQPNGALAWQVRTPVHVAGELVLATPSGVLFGGTDGNVWAYAPHGSPLWHAGTGQTIAAGPKSTGSRVFVATIDGELMEFDGAVRKRTLRVDVPCDSIVGTQPDGSVTVIAGGALVGLGPNGEVRFRREGVAWADATPDGLVAAERGRVTRLDTSGAVVRSARIDGIPSAAPVVSPSGFIYVPEVSGAIVVVKDGRVRREVPVATAALHRPVLDVARRRLVVAAGNGIVAALRLEE